MGISLGDSISSILAESGLVKNEEAAEALRLNVAGQRALHQGGGAGALSGVGAGTVVSPEAVNGAGSVNVHVELSAESLVLLAGMAERPDSNESEEVRSDRAESLNISKILIESLTGRKLKALKPDRTGTGDADVREARAGLLEEGEAAEQSVYYLSREVVVEEKEVLLKATGRLRTANGAERGFDIRLRIRRSVYSEHAVSFAQTGADGSGETESSGTLESNFSVGGTVVTGQRRLFAPASAKEVLSYGVGGGPVIGNGYVGVGIFDVAGTVAGDATEPGFSDNTGRASDDDSVYRLLRVVAEGPDGQDRLISLKEIGIESVYLYYSKAEATVTEAAVKGSERDLKAEVGGTGSYSDTDRASRIDLHA